MCVHRKFLIAHMSILAMYAPPCGPSYTKLNARLTRRGGRPLHALPARARQHSGVVFRRYSEALLREIHAAQEVVVAGVGAQANVS